jgi:hypothetical protein
MALYANRVTAEISKYGRDRDREEDNAEWVGQQRRRMIELQEWRD